MRDNRSKCVRVFNSRRVMLTALLTAFFCSPVYLISRESGLAGPTGLELRRTGGNFPGERTCTDVDCHIGSPNTGPGSLSITANGVPINQFNYSPGETVPIVVTVAQQGRVRWGFQATARTENGCSKAGEMAVSPNDQQVLIRTDPSRPGACPADGDVRPQFAMHLFAKAGNDSRTFEFNWTAPSSNIGNVRFAVAGNAANGDVTNGGDSIYTIEEAIEPANIQPAPKPIISQGGAVLATGTPFVTSGTPNAILTVFGQEFAPAGTFVIAPEFDENTRIATNLANTCVEIAGRRSPMFAVFPTQINLQASHAIGLGAMPVVVIRACGTAQESRSDPEMMTFATTAPAFFNFTSNLEGTNPIATLHGGGPNLVGSPGTLPGATFTPAQPGEIISLFATGMGATNPAFEAGQIPQIVNPANPIARVTANATVSIGGIQLPPEDVLYIGVAPCCAGLYQLVARVPAALATGNHQVVVTIDGVATPAGPFIAVERPQ